MSVSEQKPKNDASKISRTYLFLKVKVVRRSAKVDRLSSLSR